VREIIFYKTIFIVLTYGFRKKSQRTPKSEIELAENRKKDFLEGNYKWMI